MAAYQARALRVTPVPSRMRHPSVQSNCMSDHATRRTVLRAAAVGTVGLAGALAGCAEADRPTQPAAPAAPPATNAPAGRRVLVAFFSRAGENYYYGGRRNLTVGNTEVVA